MLVAAQAEQIESTTAGMVAVLVILAILTLIWLWAVWHLYREGRWKEGLKETALVTLWIGLLAGGAWLLARQINLGREVARRAIPEYCPQVQAGIRGGSGPMEAAMGAVRQMQKVEPAIETLDEDDLAVRLLRTCREQTGWAGFRVPEDTAPADTANDTVPDAGEISPLPGTGTGG